MPPKAGTKEPKDGGKKINNPTDVTSLFKNKPGRPKKDKVTI